jgi:hypothetical protein
METNLEDARWVKRKIYTSMLGQKKNLVYIFWKRFGGSGYARMTKFLIEKIILSYGLSTDV